MLLAVCLEFLSAHTTAFSNCHLSDKHARAGFCNADGLVQVLATGLTTNFPRLALVEDLVAILWQDGERRARRLSTFGVPIRILEQFDLPVSFLLAEYFIDLLDLLHEPVWILPGCLEEKSGQLSLRHLIRAVACVCFQPEVQAQLS